MPYDSRRGMLSARPRTILLVIATALVGLATLFASQSLPARAAGEGTFQFETASISVIEGESAPVFITQTGRTATSPAIDIGLTYAAGTAEPEDFFSSVNECVTFGHGVTAPQLAHAPDGFSTNEDADTANETFTVTLNFTSDCTNDLPGEPHGTIGSPATVTVTILDDDGPPTFQFATNSSSVVEGAGVRNVLVVRAGDVSAPGSVECHVDGGSADPGDYTFSPTIQIVAFDAGESQAFCEITINEDEAPGDQVNETVTLELQDPFPIGSIGANSHHTLTIVDNDVQTVACSQPNYDVSEGAGSAVVTIIRANPSGTVDVDWNLSDGSNVTTADYTDDASDVIFIGTDTSESFSVSITQDALVEGDQVINVNLAIDSGSATIPGGNPACTITIKDDENVGQFVFSAVNYNVFESDGTVTLTVNRINGSTGAAAVSYELQSGTAIPPADYLDESGTLNFSSGDTAETITITINPDQLVEATDQSFTVLLLDPTNGTTLGDPNQATVTIIDDDGPPPTILSVSPNSGTSLGNFVVNISGTGFTGALVVSFGGVESTNFIVNSANSISALAPPHANGLVDIRVITHAGISPNTAADNFTYTGGGPLPSITSVAPNTGPLAGGNSVIISGTNLTGALSVMFGSTPATNFVVNSAISITATAPAHAAGLVDVSVTTLNGTNLNTAADNYTYGNVTTQTYQLSVRWNLIAYLGPNNADALKAISGTLESPDDPATNNISAFVTAIAEWDAVNQEWLFFFPTGIGVPGANDFDELVYGRAYWLAVSTNVSWTVQQGP